MLVETSNGRTRLIVIYVPHAEDDDAGAMKQHLAQHLPAAWQPHAYVKAERLPYTLNGKLDRDVLKALAAAHGDTPAMNHIAPATDTEQRLARVWQRILDARPLDARIALSNAAATRSRPCSYRPRSVSNGA